MNRICQIQSHMTASSVPDMMKQKGNVGFPWVQYMPKLYPFEKFGSAKGMTVVISGGSRV